MLGLERIDEIVNRYARLFEQTGKRADLQLAMIGNNTTLRCTTENDVTAALAGDHKTEML